MPRVGDDLGDAVVERVGEGHPARVLRGQGAPGLDPGRVGVDADQLQLGGGLEQDPGVPGAAEGGVDEDRRTAVGSGAGERGQQQGGHPAGHHRHMRIGVLAH